MIATLLAFIIALGLLIIFHEYGHYQVACWCDVKVLRFSVGFGKPFFVKRFGKDQTEWVLSAFPLGGYVKMLDEREGDVSPEEQHRAFNRKSVWQRIAIVAAGPIANFLLAILLYWLLFMMGVSGMKPVLGKITPSTPAAYAGFKEGNTITKINQENIATWQDARWILLSHAVDKLPDISIETVDQHDEITLHTLDLSNTGPDDLNEDFLKRIGLNIYQPTMPPVVGKVLPDSAASHAGLLPDDEILSVNGNNMTDWEDLVQEIRTHPGETLFLTISRAGATLTLSVITEVANEKAGKTGKIGIGPKIDQAGFEELLVEVSYPAGQALIQAARKTWETSVFTLQMLWKMVAGDVSWKNISGPITIADYAGQSAKMGTAAYIGFLALISISLGVMNLLPVPVLDGGHLMYYLVEIIKGSPLSDKTMEAGQQAGMTLLFALMAFALYNDINRFVSG